MSEREDITRRDMLSGAFIWRRRPMVVSEHTPLSAEVPSERETPFDWRAEYFEGRSLNPPPSGRGQDA